MMIPAPEPLAFSINEASRAARTGRTKLYHEIAAGRLRAVKRGRGTLILRDDLITWLNALEPAVRYTAGHQVARTPSGQAAGSGAARETVIRR